MSPIAPIPDVDEPDRLPRSVGLGRLAENSLVRFVVQLFNRAKDGIAELIRNALERLLESLERPLANMVGGVLDDVLAMPGLPPNVRNVLSQTRNPEEPVAIVGLIVAVASVLLMFVPAALSGVSAKVKQISFFVTRPYLIDFNAGFNASLRDPKYRELFINNLQGAGWTDEQIEAGQLAAVGWLDIGTLFSLWRRGEITETEFEERLRAGAMAPEAIPLWKKLKGLIPGPSDLVRFALREAWRDDVAAKYGYDQGDTGEFTSWMEKQGYGPEWSQAYWRSHWEIPPTGMGFDMLHRDIISETELVELLKINDLAPGWIDKVVQLARPLPGRIDRRWAFQEGEITEAELKQLYLWDGYTDKWAEILANTVIKRSVSDAKGMTRAAIVSAYKKRRLSSAEAVSMLEDIGIPSAVAQFYLGQADSDHADDLLDRRIGVVGKQFSVGDLSESETRDALGQLGVGSSEIAVYLEEWGISRATKVKRPSRANLDKFFKGGVINVASYRDQMDRLGYSGLYVDWYLAALAVERQELTEKEERAARVEADRVARDRRKTDYQLAKSRIDVDIAELNAAIASSQVALIEAQNERDQRLTRALPVAEIAALEREYQPLLFDAEAAISEARLQVSRLQATIKVRREEITIIDQSLVENVDMSRLTELRAERLTAQTEQARLGELIATDRVVIAQLKEAIAAFTDADEIDAAKAHILALGTEIAQYQEQQAFHLTRIKELDEFMAVVLSPVRRSELVSAKSGLGADIASIESEIALLREEIRSVQGDREELQRELDTQTLALPGSEVQIAIRSEFLTMIGEIESNIKAYRENVAQLRLEKSRLTVEWRE